MDRVFRKYFRLTTIGFQRHPIIRFIMSSLQKLYLMSPICLQNLFCTLYGFKERRIRYGKAFHKYLNWLEKSQWWSLGHQIEYQNSQLKRIINLAYEQVPFYTQRLNKLGLKPQEIQTVEDLQKLPLMTKEDVVAAGETIYNQYIPKSRLIHGHTSGTTGSALTLAYTRDCVQFQWAVWWRHRARFGMTIKNRGANFGGSLIVPFSQKHPPFWRENRVFNQTVFSQYHLTNEFFKHYLQKLNQDRYDYFAGYPSNIFLLANYLAETRQKLQHPPSVVFTGAENLEENQRDLITEHIAKPTDEYGAAEYAANASKCECDYYHIDMEFGLMEVIPLQGLEQSDERIRGNVVVTGFTNPAMPLVRYMLGDIATYLPNFKCPCGRQAPVLECIDGRSDSYVVTRDGRRVARLGFLFKNKPWIKESQIRQSRPGEITIKLVPRKSYTPDDLDRLLKDCRLRLGDDMKVELDFVQEIPRAASGKFRAVISTVDQPTRLTE